MGNHKSVKTRRVHTIQRKQAAIITLKCRIKVIWMTPAIKPLLEVPEGLFLRQNQL